MLKLFDVEMVDQINQIEMTWQKFLKKRDRPFFKGFRQNCVVGVGKRFVDDVPCLTIRQHLHVYQDAE